MVATVLERRAHVCNHGFEKSSSYAEIMIAIVIVLVMVIVIVIVVAVVIVIVSSYLAILSRTHMVCEACHFQPVGDWIMRTTRYIYIYIKRRLLCT